MFKARPRRFGQDESPGYGFAWPVPASRLVGGHRDYQVLDPGNVVHDRVAVMVPAIDTEAECGTVHEANPILPSEWW